MAEDEDEIEYAFLDKDLYGVKHIRKKEKGTNKKLETLKKLSKIESELNLREKFLEEFQ